MELYVLLRRLPTGSVIAASVDVPTIVVEHPTEEGALAALTSELRDALRRATASWRAWLGRSDPPELLPVAVEIPLARKHKPVKITVDTIVVRRPTSNGELFLARVAGLRHFQVAVEQRTELRERLSRALRNELEDWPIDSWLSFDSIGETSFTTVDITLRPVAEAAGSDEVEGAILEELGDDLVARAREGSLAPLDGRDDLVDRVLAALASEGRSSVLLVGPRDVGKTTLVYEVARRLATGAVPAPLRERELWRISANELIAGARYTGMWQDRARRLVAEARDSNAILMMGDPAGILDAGRWSESSNSLGRFLRTYMETGEISVICEGTQEVVAAGHRQEPSFIDAMHRVEIAEPSAEEALAILRAAAGRLAERGAVTIVDDAVAASVELTRRYEPYRSLPGKAVHLLEETLRRGDDLIERQDVVETFATRSGLPVAMLSDEVPLDLDAARRFFVERVLGQPHAVDAVVDLIGVIKAGLNAPGRPLGTFFFVGPTGVGKTELAKALAEFLFGDRDRLLRFDMGEYALADAIPRLIGTAWQSGDEGELTRRVREQPFSIVLLDEIEKAHHDVFDVLLSALGEGRLTDSNGRTADFRNAIVIMTSNLGASRRQSGAVGFATGGGGERERLREHYHEAAKAFFRPEFVNRIDSIVAFDELDREIVRRIARREVGRLILREGLVRRQLIVEVDDGAVEKLADAGLDPQYGARPLQRQIEHAVIQPLARLIVAKRPARGDVVRLRVVGDELTVELEPPPPTPEERRAARRERRAAPARATTARAAQTVDELVEAIAAEADGAVAQIIAVEVTALVERTQSPSFWDEPEEARRVMSRVYTLERTLDRLKRLHDRARGLTELSGHARRTGDTTRVAEILGVVDELAEALELVRLELHGASAGASDGAVVVRVTPIGHASEGWADELAAMYRAWAERTGRDVAAAEDGGAPTVVIEGPATLELLAGETGLHRRRLADRRERDARVSVGDADGDAVVRVYEEGRRTGVRDPRTGIRESSVADVLHEGRIDRFLLAALDRARLP